ncbi:MAG: undecaprenyl-diphosphate phosphatase [Pseudomonadota bacterium]
MNPIALLQAVLLGILQGLTEFLPVSSTAHLRIAERLLGFQDDHGAFTVMIQLGSILAVMWLYRARIIEVVMGLPTKPQARRFAIALFCAFVPAVIAGIAFGDLVTDQLYDNMQLIASAFILGGIAMIAIERFRPPPVVKDALDTPLWRAIGVGLFQCIALIPGVSRSGATIFGGLIMQLDRRAAAEFSFFLAMPTMVAAFAHEFWKQKDTIMHTNLGPEIAVGFVFAFISAWLVVKPFLAAVTRVGFGPFALYRILIGGAVLMAHTLHYL